jgi:hypothetical protein
MDLTGLGSVFDFGSKIIDKLWPDPAKADAAKLELFKLQQQGEFKQMDQVFELAKSQVTVNTEEAKSSNLFVSGWRPSIGWVCSFALTYQYIVRPLLSWGLLASGHTVPVMPGLDDNLWQLLLGMLGLGGLRTFEKVKGVA